MLSASINPTKFRVDKNFPIPSLGQLRGRPLKYPLNIMEIGDSFSFDAADLGKVRASTASYSARHGRKFVVRQEALRCWRVG